MHPFLAPSCAYGKTGLAITRLSAWCIGRDTIFAAWARLETSKKQTNTYAPNVDVAAPRIVLLSRARNTCRIN